MNYFLTEEQEMIRDLCRRLAEEKIRPIAAKCDEEQIFPWDVVKEMAEADLFGIFIPEEYGGLGGGVMELSIAVEELSKACGGIALALAARQGGARVGEPARVATRAARGCVAHTHGRLVHGEDAGPQVRSRGHEAGVPPAACERGR